MSGIRVELELDDGQFVSRVLHAGETLEQFNRNAARTNPHLVAMANSGQLVYKSFRLAEQSSRDFLGTLRDLTVVLGIGSMAMNRVRQIAGGWIGDIVRVNAEMERMTFLMRSMSVADDRFRDAANKVNEFRKMAERAPFSLRQIQDTAVKLQSVGIEPLNGSLQALLDGVAAFGGSDEVMKRASVAIQQMAGKGVIQMEELRQQLGEAVPRATELMARSMGVSYGDLVKKISSGTVLALPALRAMQLEFHRTFGGSAAEMMNSFTGQLQRFQTVSQQLALEAGKNGFFAEVKNQMADINTFLSGGVASQLARELGEGLAKAVQGLRKVVDTIIDLRHEIIVTAKFGGIMFAGWLGVKGIGAIVSGIQAATLRMRAMRAEMELVGRTVAANNALFQASQMAMNMQPGGPTSLVLATRHAKGTGLLVTELRNLKAILPAVGAALTAVAPWLGIVATAAFGAANYFDIFSNSARAAWQEMEKFGAFSLKQVEEGSKVVENLKVEIERMEREIEASQIRMISNRLSPTQIYEALKGRFDLLEKKQAELREMQRQQFRFEQQAIQAEAQERSRIVERELQARLQDIRSAYDKESIAMEEAYNKQRRIFAENNKSTKELDDKHKADRLKKALEFHDKEIEIYKEALAVQEAALKSTDAVVAAAAKTAIAGLTERLRQLILMRQEVETQVMGIQTSPKVQDYDKLLEKARAHLENMKEEGAGLRAQLAGASKESGKLVYMLKERLKFGDINDPDLAPLIAEMEAQQAINDSLEQQIDLRERNARAARSASEALEEDLRALADREAAAIDRLMDPLEQKRSSSYARAAREMIEHVEAMKRYYGADSAAYRKALDDKEAYLRRFRNVEIMEQAASLAEQNRENARSLMTQKEAVQDRLNFEIAGYQRLLDEFRGNAEDRALIEKNVLESMRLARERAALEDPIKKLFHDWKDMGAQFSQDAAGWFDGLADALGNMIAKGKMDFKSLIDSMLADLSRLIAKWLILKALGFTGFDLGSIIPSAKGNVFKNGDIIKAFAKGGVVSAPTLFPMKSGIGLMGEAGEEAILPLKRTRSGDLGVTMEGASLGVGGPQQVITLAPNITINANGGTPDQNRDLAAQVSTQVERSLRGLIVQELRQQMRPRGLLNP